MTDAIDNRADSPTAPHGIAWLMLLVGLLHVPSLFNPFLADDYVYLGKAHDLTWAEVPALFTSPTMGQEGSSVWWTPEGVLPFYRPLAILSFTAEYHLLGMNPFGYHLANTLLHVLNMYLLAGLAMRLGANRWLALAAALIFGIHPVHSEAVLWISGRFDVLVCSIMLGAANAYLLWRDGKGAKWAVLVCVLFLCGLGTKETAIILPAVLLAGECVGWRAGSLFERIRAFAPIAVTLGAFAIAYLALRFWIFGGMGELPPPYGVDLADPSAAGRILRAMGQYLLDFVLLIHVDAFYLDGFWAEHYIWLMLLVAVAGALVIWGWRLAGRTLAFRVGVLWSLLFIAPALKTMPGERNIYLASAGVALAAASVLAAAWEVARAKRDGVRRIRRVSTALVALCVALACIDQVIMWSLARTSQTVYDDLMAALPDPPPNSQVFIINQCPLNAGGFDQGVRLHYGRDDLTGRALTLAPMFQGVSRDRVYQVGPSTIRIVRENGVIFESFLEKFALFSRPVSTMATSARRYGLELLTPLTKLENVTEIEMSLPEPIDTGRMHLFTWDNQSLQSLTQVTSLEKWPRLAPTRILESSPTVAHR